jgi:ATP-dependent RNA helicase DDX46/PRP5
LPFKVLQKLAGMGFEEPTPIQAQAMPAVMAGRDVIGIASTGSGKTLAFLLPLLRHVLAQPPLAVGDGPIGLVLCPARELALQTRDEAKKFSAASGVKAVAVYGGGPMVTQIAKLKRGAEIIVATPGRLIDLLCANQGRVTNLRRVSYLVLDEADRYVAFLCSHLHSHSSHTYTHVHTFVRLECLIWVSRRKSNESSKIFNLDDRQ